MHLSTSNSNERLPKGNWLALWPVVFILILVIIIFFELRLRELGWSPSVIDSKQLWSYHRKRATELNSKAIILVGGSRIQLGIDLATIKDFSNLEPVQLAIDGSSFMPILRNLAQDPNIRGTVIVSVIEDNVNAKESQDKSVEWASYYENIYQEGVTVEPYRRANNSIKSFLDGYMVTRLEGARPFTVINLLLFNDSLFVNYLITNSDRSRDANYKKVRMPAFYEARVQRHYGEQIFEREVPIEQFNSIFSPLIENIKSVDKQVFMDGMEIMLKYIQDIERHGGKVILVRFPTSKLVYEIDKRRYPRNNFWDVLAQRHSRSIYFLDYHGLTKFKLPDGSHMDKRDKKLFTEELMKIILNIT